MLTEVGVPKKMTIQKLINYPSKIDYTEYKKEFVNRKLADVERLEKIGRNNKIKYIKEEIAKLQSELDELEVV